MTRPNRPVALWCGLLGFLLVTVSLWPMALSFADEIGYVGQARLFLQGQIALTPDSVVSFNVGPGGQHVSRYPLFVPAVLTPLLALHPPLVFAVGLLSLLAAVLVAARALRRWGMDPAFALALLIHPTLVLVSRTTMPDVWLTAAALAAWSFDEEGRPWLTALMFALVLLLKPTGSVIVAALLLGRIAVTARDARSLSAVARRVSPALAGSVLGASAVGALNVLSWGHVRYPYDVMHAQMNIPIFSLAYLPSSGVAQALSIALVPPGLIVGAWGLWRRRQLGPLLVVVGMLAMMSVYFFFDYGRSRWETLVLTQRLVLPASAFLLVGVGVLLSPLLARLRGAALIRGGLAVAGPAMALVIGWQQRAWQRPMREALVAADAIAARQNVVGLGTTYSAAKAALLHDGPVSLLLPGNSAGTNPPVALCSVGGGSYRERYATSCDLPGYEARQAFGPMRVLAARRPSAVEGAP